MQDFSVLELGALVGAVIIAAIFAGILAGLLGVGGGIVLVPVLFWLLSLTDFPAELAMHMAVATSLLTIVFTSISSARSHHKRGSLDRNILRLWAPGIVLGALCGGLSAKFVTADVLRGVFGGVALIVALNMAWNTTLIWCDGLPENRWVNAAVAWITGVFSALMGIGGGTLGVPTLVGFGVDIRRAVGTASAFGVLIAVPAVFGFIWAGSSVSGRPWGSVGYVNVPAALLILPFTATFAPIGATLSHRISTSWMKRCFAIFLGLTALRMLIG